MSKTLKETLPISSASSLFFNKRAVILVPDFPANGEVLVPINIEILGSSTVITGKAIGLSGSANVSPMVISSIPATAIKSPGPA